MLTQEQIQDAVNSSLPNVLDGLKKEIADTAINQAKSTVAEEVRIAVSAYVKDEIIPLVLKELAEEKSGLISCAPKMAKGISDEITKALLEGMRKKMESSWERKKIFEAIIG